ncbi:MAG: NAD(P)-dependent oxidoreductase [Acidobacteria bacterium]|nr:NAD(P)-dependent oxidoreductase [Acidobacteriota bacterium]MYJ05289.1 NAD(P)-dependent oxidoreductase [Acidobacteriota bacterium]
MRVGFIGLGVMGRPMALNLLHARHDVTVWARRPETAEPLVERGAAAAASPAALAARCDVVFTMLTGTADVEQVLLGDDGVAGGAEAGLVVIDTSTIDPLATRKLAAALAERRIDMLDAPVSGGPHGARDATLSIMVGGDAAVLERVRPLLDVVGAKVRHMGGHGAGQATKACHQLLLLVTAQGVAESLALARRAGLDVGQVREAMLDGMASSRVLDFFGDRMARRDFAAGIESRLYHKDLDIVLGLAHTLGVSLPAGAVTMQFINGLHGRGLGRDDLSSLLRLVEEQGGGAAQEHAP